MNNGRFRFLTMFAARHTGGGSRIMRNRMLPGILALVLFAVAFAAPAGAITITVGGAPTDFTFLANTRAGFESGPTVIVGNVGVIGANSILDVGSNVRIIGRAIAHRINVSSGAVIDVCEADFVVGPGTCTTTLPFPTVPTWPPLPPISSNACVDTAPGFTVAPGDTQPLPPGVPAGCFGIVKIGAGGKLTVGAGSFQVLDLQLDAGATIDGAGPAATTITSKKVITVLPNSVIQDIRIQTPLGPTTAEVIQIGSGTTIVNSILYGPFGKAHIHDSTIGTNTEVVANTLHIEPVQFDTTPQESCPCIKDATKTNATTINLTGIGLTSPPTNFFLSLGCGPCPGAGCTAAVPKPGGTDTVVDLTIPASLNGTNSNYHVIAQGSSGTFCTSDLINIP